MANRIRLPIDEWIDELKAEPASLATASRPLVQAAADAAATEIRNAYPVGPGRKWKPWRAAYSGGNLKAGVFVRKTKSDPAVSSGVLVSSAPHAHLYEDGTHVARAHPTFWPTAHRHQKELQDDLMAMVQARGYTVTGG